MAYSPGTGAGLGASVGTALAPGLGTALGFAGGSILDWIMGRRRNSAAKRAHDERYNSPAALARNAYLTQMWREHNLAERFKDAFPDPNDPKYAGQSVKTPENVLIAATSAPRFTGGESLGGNFLDALVANAGQFPMPTRRPVSPVTGADDFSEYVNFQLPQTIPFRRR